MKKMTRIITLALTVLLLAGCATNSPTKSEVEIATTASQVAISLTETTKAATSSTPTAQTRAAKEDSVVSEWLEFIGEVRHETSELRGVLDQRDELRKRFYEWALSIESTISESGLGMELVDSLTTIFEEGSKLASDCVEHTGNLFSNMSADVIATMKRGSETRKTMYETAASEYLDLVRSNSPGQEDALLKAIFELEMLADPRAAAERQGITIDD